MFITDTVTIDWMTITTYDDETGEIWKKYLTGGNQKPKKVMQYSGKTTYTDNGSIFVGVGTQRQMRHYMLRASGYEADSVFQDMRLKIQTSSGLIKCTRLDIALTIEATEGYDSVPINIFGDLAALDTRTKGYVESFDREVGVSLGTVYLGNRKSDRLVRIYDKPGANGDLYLRFEVEYKGLRSDSIARKIAKDETALYQQMKYEIQHYPVQTVHTLFAPCLMGVRGVNVKIERPLTNTQKWIIDQCIPAIRRELSGHDPNKEIAAAIRDMVSELDIISA